MLKRKHSIRLATGSEDHKDSSVHKTKKNQTIFFKRAFCALTPNTAVILDNLGHMHVQASRHTAVLHPKQNSSTWKKEIQERRNTGKLWNNYPKQQARLEGRKKQGFKMYLCW